MPSTSERRQASDMTAYRHLGNYEVKRNKSNGNFAIFLRGTQTQCGTIFQRAQPLVRAMMVVTEASKNPAADRARLMHEGPRGVDPATGKRRYSRKLVSVS
jgi:hypothetical protein